MSTQLEKSTKRPPLGDAWQFVAAAYTLIGPAVAVFLRHDVPGGTLLAGVGLASVLLGRLPDIAEFSGFGVSAKMREKIQEAEVTLAAIRDLAGKLSVPIVSQMAMHGAMMQRIDFGEQAKQIEGIAQGLRSMGMTEVETRKALDFWCYISARKLVNIIGQAISDDAAKTELSSLRQGPEEGLTADAVSGMIGRHNALTPEVVELIEDLREVLATGRIRRPSVFPVGILP